MISAPYFDDMEGVGERYARDVMTGERYKLPKDTTYEQWLQLQDEKYGAGTVDKARRMEYNESADIDQYAGYRERLGADAPKTFAEFRRIKYSDPKAYEDISGYYKYKGDNPDSNTGFYQANNAVKAMRTVGTVKTKGTITSAPQGRSIIKINTHAMQRMVERGISQEMAQRIIDNAAFAVKQRNGAQYVYYTQDGFAVLDNNGVLGSTGPLDEGGKVLYNEVMRYVGNGK